MEGVWVVLILSVYLAQLLYQASSDWNLPCLRTHTLFTEHVQYFFLQLLEGYFYHIIFIKYITEEIFLPSKTSCTMFAVTF